MQETSPHSKNPVQDLIDFARQYGPADVNYEAAELQPLSGDAGFRRYYRLSSQPSLMLVDSPPEKELNLEYVKVSDFLKTNGISVPRIHTVDFERGLFVLEDLGDRLLQNELTTESAQELYNQTLAKLLNIQSISDADRPDWIKDYSAQKLLEEMRLFTDWFVEKLLGVEIGSNAKATIEQVFDRLVQSAQEQPKVFVHKDFHCRNLMLVSLTEDYEKLSTIDFQDAVWGPISYDLASLCRDCYVRWNPQRVAEMVQDYGDKLLVRNLISTEQQEQLPRWVDWMGLQRHIKVLGIFSRLYLRDGKSDYLDDLPLVLRYTLEVLNQYSGKKGYPEFSDLNNWIREELIPVAESQSWYKDWQTAGNQLDF